MPPASRGRGRRPAQTREAAQESREQATRSVVVFDAEAAKSAAREIEGLIERRTGQIEKLLLQSVGPSAGAYVDRFLTVAMDAVTRDNRILQADHLSIVAAVRTAAMYGLEPSPVMGDGAIVVYWNSKLGKNAAQFQPMYRGLAKLARRSPQVAGLDWQLVKRNDHFRPMLGTMGVIEHEPVITGDPGDVIGAYAFARLTSGFVVPMYMTLAEIERVRDQSSRDYRDNGEKSLWAQWREAMVLKTPVRRLMTKLDLDPLAALALAADAVTDRPVARVIDPTQRQVTSGLRRRLGVGGQDDAPQDEAGQGASNGDGVAPDGATGETDQPGASTEGETVCGEQAPEGDVAEGELCAEAPDHAERGTVHKAAGGRASWPLRK